MAGGRAHVWSGIDQFMSVLVGLWEKGAEELVSLRGESVLYMLWYLVPDGRLIKSLFQGGRGHNTAVFADVVFMSCLNYTLVDCLACFELPTV